MSSTTSTTTRSPTARRCWTLAASRAPHLGGDTDRSVVGESPTAIAPFTQAPPTFVAVFSRRSSAQRRSLIRDMWLKVQYASHGNVTVKFVLCRDQSDGLQGAIDKEHSVHGDIYMLACKEGSNGTLLTQKTLLALRAFKERFPNKVLFMKVHDDSFVRWSHLWPFLSENAGPNVYMGDLQPESPVCRDESHPHFVATRTFRFENYPASMASKHGLILGRSLVEQILSGTESIMVPNADRAVGIWVNRQKKTHAFPVKAVQFDAPTADEHSQTPESRRPMTWGAYNFMAHHGLGGETIACLAIAEERDAASRSISDCFARHPKEESPEVPPCAMQPTKTNFLQRHTSVKHNFTTRHKSRKLRATKELQNATEEVFASRKEFPGSKVDWKTHRQRLTFVHIPKNGGTAIEQAGQAGGVWWPRKWLTFWHGLTMPDGSVCEKYHVPPQYLKSFNEKDWIVFDDPGTFCVTRHPYERAVSEYKYMLSVAWGRSMSQMYNTGLYDKPKCTAEGLNNFLTKAVQNALAGKRFQHDCHMLPQSEFIWGHDGKQWCRHILRTERMEAGFNELMERYKYPVRLSVGKNSSERGRINNSSDACPGLSAGDLALPTRRLLDALYKNDFEWLNYSQSQKDLVFMHIPRNFGTLVEGAAAKDPRARWPGRRKGYRETRVQMPESSWCNKIDAPVQHLEAEDAALYLKSEVFCIARHPYERVVSVFNQVVGMKDRAEMLSYYSIQVGEEKMCSPKGLNNFVRSALDAMNMGRTFALDCQLAPQHMFIWDDKGNQVCNNIVKTHDLPGGLDHLLAKTGFADMNFTEHMRTAPPKPKAACSMTPGNIMPEFRKQLDIFYKEDFVKLGFQTW